MAKPFPLQTLLDLAQERSDAAAARLGAANGHKREMQVRLELLLEYRSEYAQRLATASKTGMDSVGLRNFHVFIDKIDTAIAQQREQVATAKRQVELGQNQWHTQQRSLKSFDTLSRRHSSAERRVEARLEQKEQDEFALRGFLGQTLIMG